MRRSQRITWLAAGIAVLVASGCGSEDFSNEPRPPAPIELTAKIDKEKVAISPRKDRNGDKIGAGLATITVSNLTDEDGVRLMLSGPTDNASDPLVAGGVTALKLPLDEGEYTLTADGVEVGQTTFAVGPERPTSQNQLLLP